ncbi:MAG: VCBS repeat-containing protein [Acidobacteria bacterium]|nr:VCBS repeat-containing protein [Acidobacteriota bacterium]
MEQVGAQDEMLARKNQNYKPSLLGRVNPFLPDPTPTPTPQLSKELIYAGQRLLAVEDANANAAPPADLAVWRPSSGVWWVLNGNQQTTSQQWGLPADKPVPGDYDGDGKTDFAIWRNGDWWIMRSSDSSNYMISLGAAGDAPAQADFDGDGRTDPAVYHEDGANGVWKILLSTTNQVYEQQYGLASDTPAPADYDGDGRADLAVRRESNNTFYSRNSSNSQTQSAVIGTDGRPARPVGLRRRRPRRLRPLPALRHQMVHPRKFDPDGDSNPMGNLRRQARPERLRRRRQNRPRRLARIDGNVVHPPVRLKRRTTAGAVRRLE